MTIHPARYVEGETPRVGLELELLKLRTRAYARWRTPFSKSLTASLSGVFSLSLAD
jgi:hypothetical protein